MISLNFNGINSPIERHKLTDCICKQDPEFCCIQETHHKDKERYYIRVKVGKNVFHANGHKKEVGVAILTSNKIDFNHVLSSKMMKDTSY